MVLESTTYPGTTEEIVAPRMLQNGLVLGEDVFFDALLAYRAAWAHRSVCV